MKRIIKSIKIIAFTVLGLTSTTNVMAQSCVTPVITSISNDSPVCEGESITLSATGTVGGVSSSSVRMAAIGRNAGHRAFNEVFSSGDRAGSIARISNAQFDAIFASQTTDAARASALKNVYDVLMFTWASPNDNNITWGLITAYLNLGGSVFFDGDYANVDNLYDGTSNSVVGYGTGVTYGCNYDLVTPAPFPSLVANGVSGCFANDHLVVTSWPSWMEAYITAENFSGTEFTLAIAGIYPGGNHGRLIVQGPDQDYHADRGASGTAGNQYQMILNQMDFLSANQAGFTWTGPNGFSSNDANPVIPNATSSMAGTYTARLTNTTGGGCYVERTTSVTVNPKPVLTCPSDLSIGNSTGNCGSEATFSATSTGSPTISYAPLSGSYFNLGSTPVTVTAVNGCGTDECSFNVIVSDTEKPTITCASSQTVNTDANSCSHTISGTDHDPTVTSDNCSVASVTNDYNGGASLNGATFGLGSTTVIWTVTDGAGNTETCSSTITVVDMEDPIISCVGDQSKTTDDDECSYTVVGSEFDPASFTDNCSVASVTNDYNNTASLSGETFNTGTTTVVWTVTDGSGNTASCSYDVEVVDDEDPVIQGENNNITVNFDAGRGAPASYTEAGITFLSLYGSGSHVHLGDRDRDGSNDIYNHSSCCSTPYRLTVGSGTEFTLISMDVKQVSGSVKFYVYPSGASVNITSTGTFTFPSGFENVTEVRWHQASGGMTIDDLVVSTKTTGSCPADIAVSNDTDKCGANVDYSASVTDNCSASIAFSPASGSFFSIGTTTVTATATDASSNTSTCTFEVTVSDDQAPTISCVSDQSRSTNSGVCSYTTVGDEFDPTAYDDNCSGSTILNDYNNSSSLSGATFSKGTTSVTWTVTDASGNTTSCSNTITVTDDEKPTISCASSDTRETQSGVCTYTVDGSEFDPVASGDNCSVSSVTNNINGGNSLDGEVLNVGTTTVTWTVVDGSGNSETCTTDITVEDNTLPTVVTQNVTVTLSNGASSIDASDIDNGSNDACGIASLSVSPSSFDCDDIGDNTVTLTVVDANGNTNTGTATVTVSGVVPTCTITSAANTSGTVIGNATTYAATNQMFLGYGAQSMNITCTASGGGGFTYAWTGTGLSNTSIANPVFTPTVGGNYTLECTVTNSYGCTTTCSILICVIDVRSSKGSAKKPKVVICHVPKGNPSNTQTLNISVNAVPAHLGLHGGCSLGACDVSCNDNKSYKYNPPSGDLHNIVYGSKEAHLIVYPNPSVNSFNFILESPIDDLIQLDVYDLNGRLIISKSGLTPNDEVDFGADLGTGMYFAVFQQGEFVKKVKIAKVATN